MLPLPYIRQYNYCLDQHESNLMLQAESGMQIEKFKDIQRLKISFHQFM